MPEEKRYHSVFDIIGPIMVGPSSSHTAGAVRIGKMVRRIFGEEPEEVEFQLFGSFAKTYRGHGTDIALVGGILEMEPDDLRLPDALQIAHEKGIEVLFSKVAQPPVHPNTVQIILKKGNHKMTATGVSIGGGNIQISEIDGFSIHLNLNTPTYFIVHRDVPGIVSRVSALFYEENINIGTLTMTRESKGEKAIMILEVDSSEQSAAILSKIEAIPDVLTVSFFSEY